MELSFERTGERRYAIEVHRSGEVLRMDPAPGYDRFFPHDLQHLIVEEQLGLTQGIFGRLAAGGSAATFVSVGSSKETKRQASRRRRKLQNKEKRLAVGTSEFDQSERATYVAWHAWLEQCDEPELRQRATAMADNAVQIRSRMTVAERERFDACRDSIIARIDQVAREWARVQVGRRMTIAWEPNCRTATRRH